MIRKSFEAEFKEVIFDTLPKDIETDYVFQEIDSLKTNIKTNPNREKPWGTGHALLTASSAINNSFAVINADDFYGADSFKLAYQFLSNGNVDSTEHSLIGYKLVNTMSDYGSVSRGVCETDPSNYIISIVERTEIKKSNGSIIFKDEENNWKQLTGSEIVSMNMFAFKQSILSKFEESFKTFLTNHGNDLKTEFYLPSVIDELIKSKEGKVKVSETKEQWFGLTYKEDKEIVKEKINSLVNLGKYPVK